MRVAGVDRNRRRRLRMVVCCILGLVILADSAVLDDEDSPPIRRQISTTINGGARIVTTTVSMPVVTQSVVTRTQTIIASGSGSAVPISSASARLPVPSSSNTTVPAGYTIPRAFDSTLGVKFRNTDCPSFFQTFLADPTTIKCVPFSLLASTSQGFFDAQKSPYSLLPFIIDASCAAPNDICSAHFAQLAKDIVLAKNCGPDLALDNALATQALVGFQNYNIMRQAGCTKDATMQRYCFVEAAATTDPSSLYYYQLPTGIGIPSGVTVCTECTRRLLALFSTYATDTALMISKTYASAQSAAALSCGPSYAPIIASAKIASSPPRPPLASSLQLLLVLPALLYTLL